ncbi:lipid A export permease/ATP-binding protein MsbA [Methylomonas sp. SURF-1]|uniref:Lipid A export permease/ATP-binding protein MsbA n=1 Tax=Methylomonas aurea TaxID=2952224 RepID=A0ABT1UKX6_9GAMM|nr:lipid A export permease/ATP-binding protein MsbA [Methylomonas sp. SURF-1]MCQ8182887.1 lipid A export permease/ATP-binding protein MsbA [Methylomonas sp. SURF-1]
MTDGQVYRRLLKFVLPYWRLFLLVAVGFAIYAGTEPAVVMIIQRIIDSFGAPDRSSIQYLPLAFVVLFLVRGIGSFLGNYYLARISGNLIHKLRCEIFNQYTRLSVQYFDSHNSGYMISRITNNIGEVTRATSDSIRSFVREGFTALGLLAYLAYTNWQLSLVFLALAPVVATMVRYVGKRLKRLSRNMQDTVGDLTQITSETVAGNRIVKSFVGEAYERQRFKAASLENRAQHRKLMMTISLNNPLMQLVISFALAGMMYLALIMMKSSSPGEFVGFFTAAFLLPKPIRQLSDANSEILRGIAAAESLFEVLDEPTEKDQGDYQTDRCRGRIEFRNLNFRYPGAETPALSNINLTIEPGQTVALVGASGGGKSTLINLLPRFYDYTDGEILIDGVELKRYRLESLRRQIALVTQHVTLFNTSVANNIAYGALQGAERSKIEQAAIDAYAMDFIGRMPHGLDTEIGENGVKLSGGQRQRLALARALLKDAPILILDEATSALDTESERYIQAALNRVMRGRTTLVVAHRLSTIEGADVILVMDKGRIVEQGSHADLLALDGAYAKLHKMQFQDPEPVVLGEG